MQITDPKQELTAVEVSELSAQLLETVNWTVSPRGVESCVDRGYNANSVASGLLGDLLEKIDKTGLDITKIVADALIMHGSYGRPQAEQAEKMVSAIAPLITDRFTREYAEMIAKRR
jgi:hypothetical protein